METEEQLYPIMDYWYELTDEQIRHGLSMTPLQRLVWLDEARRFSLLARQAVPIYYKDGKPIP